MIDVSHDDKWMNFNDYRGNSDASNAAGNTGILYLYRIENFEPVSQVLR